MKIATLSEVENYYSLSDLVDLHEALGEKTDLERKEIERAKGSK